MEIVLPIVFGAMIGVIGTMLFLPKMADGKFHIIKTDDPNYASSGIEFYKGAEQLLKQKIIILRVQPHQTHE